MFFFRNTGSPYLCKLHYNMHGRGLPEDIRTDSVPAGWEAETMTTQYRINWQQALENRGISRETDFYMVLHHSGDSARSDCCHRISRSRLTDAMATSHQKLDFRQKDNVCDFCVLGEPGYTQSWKKRLTIVCRTLKPLKLKNRSRFLSWNRAIYHLAGAGYDVFL